MKRTEMRKDNLWHLINRLAQDLCLCLHDGTSRQNYIMQASTINNILTVGKVFTSQKNRKRQL